MTARRNATPATELGDNEKLKLYLERVKQLKKATLIANGTTPSIQLNFKADKDKGVESDLEIPANDPMIALAALVRSFLMDGEVVSFTKVANIVSRLTKDTKPDLFKAVAEIRKGFLEIGPGPQEIEIVFEGNRFTHEYCLDLYLNGQVFHFAHEKVDRVKRIEQNSFVYGFYKMIVASAILDYVAPIVVLGKVIEDFLSSSGTQPGE